MLIEVDPRPDRELVAGVVAGVVEPVVVDARPGQVGPVGRVDRPQVGVDQPEGEDVVVADVLVAVDAIDARPTRAIDGIARDRLPGVAGAGQMPQPYVPA